MFSDSRRLIFLTVSVLVFGIVPLSAVGPNLLTGDFESGNLAPNPWEGVDDLNHLHVMVDRQLAVNDDGKIMGLAFSPGVAWGDLNGDGLPDLVVADAHGYFWYYRNTGKPGAPSFAQGEIMPVWLDNDYLDGSTVPRIQLIDLTGDHKLSIVAGNYAGQLFILPNLGSASTPDFRTGPDPSPFVCATHRGGQLWCNYLSPFFYNWKGNGQLDLVVGDGTYSANSIYFFSNKGANDRPTFSEDTETKIIPGMGREDLTPQVVDWNHDGKPDIIAGERTGFINVYLNQAANATDTPKFDMDKPIHVKFGSVENVGIMPTVCVANIASANSMDLIVGTADGSIRYALNTGTADAPQYGNLVPFNGVYRLPKIQVARYWVLDRFRPYGTPNGVIECVNAQTEKQFVPPPPETKLKGALKFWTFQPQATFFKTTYFPDQNGNFRVLGYAGGEVTLTPETGYTLSLWARAPGKISNLHWYIDGGQGTKTEGHGVGYNGEIGGLGSGWSHLTSDIRFPSLTHAPEETGHFKLTLRFEGEGPFYLDDIELRKN